MKLEVIPIGTEVSIKTQDFEATITGFSVTRETLKYLVTWWDKGSRHEEWVYENEITSQTKSKERVGFKIP